MEIILAKSAGFCFGVDRAVKSVYNNIEIGNLYTYGDIVHNRQIVEDLESKNVHSIQEINQLNGNGEKTVVLRAHGVPKKIYNLLDENKINYIDSTCPYVKKIHDIIEKHYKDNDNIIIIGDPNHSEIIGINGYCDNKAYIIEAFEDIDNIEVYSKGKFCVVVQTTYNTKRYEKIIKKLKEKISNEIDVYNTICTSTFKRQEEADKISKSVNVMIVIGGKHSSNTKKLFEISKKNCKNSYHIETKEDLELQNFTTNDKIGITAGASTPEYIIKDVITKLKGIDN